MQFGRRTEASAQARLLRPDNKVKLADGESLGTGTWAPDSFHLAFEDGGPVVGPKAYIVGSDGSGLRELPRTIDNISNLIWSPDQKSIHVSGGEKRGTRETPTVWRVNRDGPNKEKLVDDCGTVYDADPGGRYLLSLVVGSEKAGIYEVSISDKKCIRLLPDVGANSVTFAPDGKSFLYAVASRGQVTIFRQPWKDGKVIGVPQVALKVPFALSSIYASGNAYDFSRDLSTIVYARPGGHADLYLLSQK